ncbi:MAG: glutamine-hydrolyzing carbamoyl-phosphate synthase small subunit [Phycisphaerales bacterium]|nr:glutamine-hydrolyzing carbamoyl-phosphate synthase small subunit [Phycisphaerales bacterium]
MVSTSDSGTPIVQGASAVADVMGEPVRIDLPRAEPIAARRRAMLELEDGTTFQGRAFGAATAVAGETVFNTGMVGYVESLTDPSYRGQLVVCTYPLIGNYGVPRDAQRDGLSTSFESDQIHASAIVVGDYSETQSHWAQGRSLSEWLVDEQVPGITGVDTRKLTQILRERGSMLGRIVIEGGVPPAWRDPNKDNLVAEVSTKAPVLYGEGKGKSRVLLIDTGAKFNIVHSLLERGVEVLRVPWDDDVPARLERGEVAGLMLSNGPGDPTMAGKAVESVRTAIAKNVPTFGICLGNQLLALAIGAKTYKLKYGHRGQNQPVIECGTTRCFVTSQNHGYAVDSHSLPRDWRPWFENLNDKTNEGIRHSYGPFRSVQFHPEACPGPVDTAFLFDEFVGMLRR